MNAAQGGFASPATFAPPRSFARASLSTVRARMALSVLQRE